MNSFDDLARFAYLCLRHCHSGRGAYIDARNASRLWNWADCQVSPESYWHLLRMACPNMFYGPSANQFRFTY